MKKIQEECEFAGCRKKAEFRCDVDSHYLCESHGEEEEECSLCQPSILERI